MGLEIDVPQTNPSTRDRLPLLVKRKMLAVVHRRRQDWMRVSAQVKFCMEMSIEVCFTLANAAFPTEASHIAGIGFDTVPSTLHARNGSLGCVDPLERGMEDQQANGRQNSDKVQCTWLPAQKRGWLPRPWL